MASYGKHDKGKSKSTPSKHQKPTKDPNLPVRYPAGHRPKGKDGQGQSR